MKRPATPTLFDSLLGTGITPEKLVSLALALGAESVPGWSGAERRLARALVSVDDEMVNEAVEKIRAGGDPLGDYFCQLRTPEDRRGQGATYTPFKIADWMVGRAAAFFGRPARVVDAGVGSARFLCRAGRAFPEACLIGVDLDPLATIIARANLAVLGMADRAKVILSDYRQVELGGTAGKTLYIGNPPYVRHHQIAPVWKAWLAEKAEKLGLEASQLAGLHVHFFLSTALRATPGDFGAFITAAEWLDVSFARLARDLFLGPLGGRRIDLIEPTAWAFPDISLVPAITAAVATFEVGTASDEIPLNRIACSERFDRPSRDHVVTRSRLRAEARWSHLTRLPRYEAAGYDPFVANPTSSPRTPSMGLSSSPRSNN